MTFDHLCRDLLLAICREHGLEVETEAIYGGRASREKNDYIIEAQREKIAELEKRNAQLTEENTNQARRLRKSRRTGPQAGFAASCGYAAGDCVRDGVQSGFIRCGGYDHPGNAESRQSGHHSTDGAGLRAGWFYAPAYPQADSPMAGKRQEGHRAFRQVGAEKGNDSASKAGRPRRRREAHPGTGPALDP